MPMYNRAEVSTLAAKYGFQRDTFEKVLRLKTVLEFFQEEKILKEHFVLKGGTSINLTIFLLPRLSVDIDMDYIPNDSKENMLATRRKITSVVKEYLKELMILTPREEEYMDCFIRGEYKPELLFSDTDILKRVETHPMALWKCAARGKD